MTIKSVSITDFRNIGNANLELHEKLNYFVGENGSGKSSLLEAVYYMFMGRSFRTHLNSQIIQHEKDAFVLFSKLESEVQKELLATGLKRERNGDIQIKQNGELLNSVSSLAQNQPLQMIGPDSFELLTGGPGVRRKFLDWGLFHVEQSFFNNWKTYKKLLSQRNALLKGDPSEREISYWDTYFIATAEQITAQRRQYSDVISCKIQGLCEKLLPGYKFDLTYQQGWEKGASLQDKLKQNREREIQLGYSLFGPHKAEFKLLSDKRPVSQVLSRGQLKLLVFACAVAQSVHLFETCNKKCVFLIDDFASELDEKNRQILFEELSNIDSQLLVSLIEADDLKKLNSQFNGKVFHVEHGNIITT